MTRISGHTSITSPCCRSLYKVVEYASMNFSVYAYWTDGAKDGGLMPNDGGLRVCRCGTAFLLRDAIRLEIEASPDTPFPPKPADADLAAVINSASSPRLEATARRNYWRYLNDGYRVHYRAHREKEKADANWRDDYRSGSVCLNNFPRTISGALGVHNGAELSTAAVGACDVPADAVGNSGRTSKSHSMQPLPVLAG